MHASVSVAADCVVDDAVPFEPVWMAEFPDNREINREFWKFGAPGGFSGAEGISISDAYSRIPCEAEQGI
jgi:hypothetical protein